MTSTDNLFEALKNAITLKATPEDLRRKIAGQWRALETTEPDSSEELLDRIIEQCQRAFDEQIANDPTLVLMQNWVFQLDATPNPGWGENSAPNTHQQAELSSDTQNQSTY